MNFKLTVMRRSGLCRTTPTGARTHSLLKEGNAACSAGRLVRAPFGEEGLERGLKGDLKKGRKVETSLQEGTEGKCLEGGS